MSEKTSRCGCKKPKCGCYPLYAPQPYISQSTCNSGCKEITLADCVVENKWISVTADDYAGSNFLSDSGASTLFKIEKLKYRKTRSKLELQGRIEFTNNWIPVGVPSDLLMLNQAFLNKIGFNPIQNTLKLKYMVVKDEIIHTISDYRAGYIIFKSDGVYFNHNFAGVQLDFNGVAIPYKVNINLVFQNDYDL